MLNREQHTDTIIELMSSDHLLQISYDYGEEHVTNFKNVMKTIKNIYRNINRQKFRSISIFMSNTQNLSAQYNGCQEIQDFSHLTSIDGPNLIIQVVDVNNIIVCRYDNIADIDINDIIKTDFVYQYKVEENQSTKEVIHTKTKLCILPPIPGSDSFFAIETFKDLKDALHHYKTKMALQANCPIIKQAMYDENRIFFVSKPEHFLRDSLMSFLNIRLRGENPEVRNEQNIDGSHPVDIKVSWGYTNHIALIEVKWLGKSFKQDTKTLTKYSESRAQNGAKQLADYLDANKQQVPNHNTIGYLVVFDMRRKETTTDISNITSENGLFYKNNEITYEQKYLKRCDFELPIRMFIEPRCSNASK